MFILVIRLLSLSSKEERASFSIFRRPAFLLNAENLIGLKLSNHSKYIKINPIFFFFFLEEHTCQEEISYIREISFYMKVLEFRTWFLNEP